MATKRTRVVEKVVTDATQTSSRLASGNDDSCGTDSGTQRRTKSSGTVVKSRYMQTEKKSAVKKVSPNESVLVSPRPAPPKAASADKSSGTVVKSRYMQTKKKSAVKKVSSLDGKVLQSTVLDDHCLRPDFDLSAIAALPSTVDPTNKTRNLELETLLLAFLTAKMENNTQKLGEEAERNLMTLMEEEEKLRRKVMKKKQRYLHLEKQQQLNDLLHLQIATLTPVAEAAKQFEDDYRTFAWALDAARHELPVRNLHTDEDPEKFLDQAVGCLHQSQRILEGYVRDVSKESQGNAACLKDLDSTAHQIDQLLPSVSSDLLDLSSLVSQETVLVQRCLEEDKLGSDTVERLCRQKGFPL